MSSKPILAALLVAARGLVAESGVAHPGVASLSGAHFWDETTAAELKAGTWDPAAKTADASPYVVRFFGRGELMIEIGQDGDRCRFTAGGGGAVEKLQLRCEVSKAARTGTWEWLGPDRARTDLFAPWKEQPRVLVRVDLDRDQAYAAAAARFQAKTLAALEGAWTDASGSRLTFGDGGARLGEVRLKVTVERCTVAAQAAACLTLAGAGRRFELATAAAGLIEGKLAAAEGPDDDGEFTTARSGRSFHRAAPPVVAARERRAKVAEKAAGSGVLGALGGGAGGSVSDVLGSGGVGAQKPAASSEPSASPAPRPEESEWPALQGIPVPTTRKFLGAPPDSFKKLGEVARFLTSRLEQHGYEEVGYFRYADGFAIATRPERIAGDASPIAERRWPSARVRKASGPQSLQDLFEVNGVEGDRYRSFLFLCTSASDVDFQGGAEQSWGLWKTGSMNPEGDVLLARPVGAHKLYAFVYELSQDKAGKVLIATSSPNTAAEHLRGAGLVVFLR